MRGRRTRKQTGKQAGKLENEQDSEQEKLCESKRGRRAGQQAVGPRKCAGENPHLFYSDPDSDPSFQYNKQPTFYFKGTVS
jgi:hypothetical protein